MEDILASIRRIIADDQNGGGGGKAPANGARRPDGAYDGDRAVTRARTPYDDVLDLARLVPSADRGPAPSAPALTPARPDVEDAVYNGEGQSARDAGGSNSGLRARLPEPTARAQAQDEDHDMLDHPVPALGDEIRSATR